MELKELNGDNGEGVDSWKEVTLIYSAALRQIETKVEILNKEFQYVHQYNPIEHVKTRIKTPESIVKKLKRNGYMLRRCTLKFVMNLMLQACPEIHSHSPDLNLHRSIHRTVRQIYRHRHYHMIALIPAGFGKGDIILHRNHLYVPLFRNHIGNLINVRGKRTNDANTCNIIYVFYHVINCRLVTVPRRSMSKTSW